VPYKDREAQLAYHRNYSIRRNRAKGRAPSGSEEARANISAAAKEGWKKRKRIDQRGELNPNWKGDTVGWNGIHWWLRRNLPKAGCCEECGKKGKTDYAFRHHPEPYTRIRDDYAELCRSCHIRFDRACRP
jgi:hypothetical protein